MIPIRDNIPSRGRPYVNYLLILACGVVFLIQLSQPGAQGELFVERYGMIPARISHPGRALVLREEVLVNTPQGPRRAIREREVPPLPFSPWWTLLTSQFLHGGWLHILGNLWFLYIFGDNVEDRFGHWLYLAVYLGSGVLAGGAHLLMNWGSGMPTIGASGAIAGIMGAYFLLYPRAQVVTILPIIIFFPIIVVPAPLFLGVWFLFQFLSGTSADVSNEGVAWWAHVGGFAAGLSAAWLLKKWERAHPVPELIIPGRRTL